MKPMAAVKLAIVKKRVDFFMLRDSLAPFTARRALPLFFALAFGLAWTCWGLAIAAQRAAFAPIAVGALQVLGAFAPLFATLIVTAFMGTTRNFLRRAFQAKIGWRWVLFALFAPAGLMLGAIGIHTALGAPAPQFPLFWQWPWVIVNFVVVLLIGGPLGEELGWRGFALPALQGRYGELSSGLMLGAIWALWHLPLFWMEGTAQALIPFGLFFGMTISLSLLYTWLFNATRGSVPICILFHASINTWSGPLRVLPSATNGLQPYEISLVLIWAAALFLVFSGRLRGQKPR